MTDNAARWVGAVGENQFEDRHIASYVSGIKTTKLQLVESNIAGVRWGERACFHQGINVSADLVPAERYGVSFRVIPKLHDQLLHPAHLLDQWRI